MNKKMRLGRTKRIRILETQFFINLTDEEKAFILNEENSEIKIENFQRDLFDKYLNPPKSPKKKQETLFGFFDTPKTSNPNYLFS